MDDFDVTFLYNEKKYTATIHKQTGRPITYFATIHKPHDLEIDNDISFVAPRQAGMLGWVNIYQYPHLAGTIAVAITDYAEKHRFNLFKN